MVLENCIITNSDATVLKEYVVSKKQIKYKEYKGYHSGVELETKEVYNAFDGKVMNVNYDDNQYSIIVQSNSDCCMKYSGLKSVNVALGEILNSGDFIGDCKKSVKVEYGNSNSVENQFPIRVMKTTFYKQNPIDVLKNGLPTVADDFKFSYIDYQNYDIYEDNFPNGDVFEDNDFSNSVTDFDNDILDNAISAKEQGYYYGGDI